VFSAWAFSLGLHGMIVGLAVAFIAQMKPVLPKNVFQWDVALVGEARPDSKSEQVDSVVAQEHQPPKKALPSQVKRVAEVSRPIMPMEPKTEVPRLRDEPVDQRMAEAAETNTEPVAEEKESVKVAASPEPVESQPAQQETGAIASAATSSTEAPISQIPASAQPQDSPVNADPAPGLEAKADNRWLAESLWRRVAELKRYPNSARMNGQEGKVILKAVIRSDGQLADVMVQKSSGHSVLDAAAIEAVKLACPLHMKHAIGKPQIVVSLPIVYSLAN